MTPKILARALAISAVSATAFGVHAQTGQPSTAPGDTRGTDALAAAFKRADANQDGRLTREEAARIPAIADRFDTYDKDKDGLLSLDELGAALVPPR